MTRGRKKTWTDEQFAEAAKKNYSARATLIAIGLNGDGANYKTVRRIVKRMGLNISHWTGQSHLRGKSATWSVKPLDAILVENSEYGNTSSLKKRLIRLGFLQNECVICGQCPQWEGKSLVMVIDHINGINNDNRLENLRLLCPNCNSQQKTFCRGVKNKHPDEAIIRVASEHGTREASRLLGLSADRIREVMRKHRMPGYPNWQQEADSKSAGASP
jgi:hypothetical protein